MLQGDRVVLGQAMTLVESELSEDRKDAVELLEKCEKHLSTGDNSIRMTVSGAPGVGKSTLIEALGKKAVSNDHKVGVITVDPSSAVSHGSILGDKSRMLQLASSDKAFVRSSPAGALLGGLGRRSFELMTILAAAGYDWIFVETVGVGQSEHIAWQLTDGFILVIQPGSGDELQGIKRGITELADIIVINKEDSHLREAAVISKSHYQNAIHYFTPLRRHWQPKTLTVSAIEGTGIDEFWEILRLFRNSRIENHQLTPERNRQNDYWLSWSLGITAHELLMNHPVVNQKIKEGLSIGRKPPESKFKREFEIENAMREIIAASDQKQE